jgi:hypothetical protein
VKMTLMVPVEIVADDNKAMVNALRRVSRATQEGHGGDYSWRMRPSAALDGRCPDCFGVGGTLPGGELYCNCDAA